MLASKAERRANLEFRILGPLEVHDGDRQLSLGGSKQRALLAILLLRANQVVPSERLIDELWGEEAPQGAAHTVQVYVSELRKVLADGVLRTQRPGYVLRVEPDELDADRFDRLREEAIAALAAGRGEEAEDGLREALALWRGPALADFAYESFAQADISRLEASRLDALEERIEADLALGRHARLVAELEALTKAHPLRERLRGQLMLALYRCGRQAEALEVYRATRAALVDELGIEPGRKLLELEQAILRQDPALDVAPADARPDAPLRRRGRGRRIAIAAVAGAAATAAAAALLATRSSAPPALAGVAANSVAVVDPARNALVAEVPVGESPGPLAAGGGLVWVANINSNTLSRIDVRARRVSRTDGASCIRDLVFDDDRIWFADGCAGVLAFVGEHHGGHYRTFDVAEGEPGPFHPYAAVAAGEGGVWVGVRQPPALVRIDPRTVDVAESITARIPFASAPRAIAAGEGAVWTVNRDGTVSRVDPVTNTHLDAIEAGARPSAITVGAGAVWVANNGDDTVSRIDPRTHRVAATIPVVHLPAAVAVGAGSVWVAGEAGSLSRIDPATNKVAATIRIGHRPQDVVVAGGLVWVSVRA